MSEMLALKVGDSEMDTYVATPDGPGPFPGVIVMHNQDALGEFTCDRVDALAALGFIAAAPDNFHRRPRDEDLKTRKKFLHDPDVVADIDGALNWLQSNPKIRKNDVAILGYCMGGRMAFLAAAARPVFRCCIGLYGGNMFAERGMEGGSPFDLLHKIRCPVLYFNGENDHNPKLDDVRKIEAELARHGIAHEFHTYPGVGHAFADFTDKKHYDEAATIDSWKKILGFLGQHSGVVEAGDIARAGIS